jgi:hypothetical protein
VDQVCDVGGGNLVARRGSEARARRDVVWSGDKAFEDEGEDAVAREDLVAPPPENARSVHCRFHHCICGTAHQDDQNDLLASTTPSGAACR